MPVRRSAAIAIASALALAACGHAVQTTSGQDYLSAYPTGATFEPTTAIDRRVEAVAAVEPALRFPARIGLARLSDGDLSAIPAKEAEAWAGVAAALGPDYGTYVPISPLIAEMVGGSTAAPSYPYPREQPTTRALLEKIRLGAARQHVDYVLVYEVYGTASSHANVLSVGDISIIGAFLLPGRTLEAAGYAQALLLDVRNGYPYGTAQATVDQAALASAWAASDSREAMMEAAATEAGVALTREVKAMMEALRAGLGPAAPAPG